MLILQTLLKSIMEHFHIIRAHLCVLSRDLLRLLCGRCPESLGYHSSQDTTPIPHGLSHGNPSFRALVILVQR